MQAPRARRPRPTSIYHGPLYERDARYRAWLTDFTYSAKMLTGSDPSYDTRLIPHLRKWYKEGIDHVDAVRRWQRLVPRLKKPIEEPRPVRHSWESDDAFEVRLEQWQERKEQERLS